MLRFFKKEKVPAPLAPPLQNGYSVSAGDAGYFTSAEPWITIYDQDEIRHGIWKTFSGDKYLVSNDCSTNFLIDCNNGGPLQFKDRDIFVLKAEELEEWGRATMGSLSLRTRTSDEMKFLLGDQINTRDHARAEFQDVLEYGHEMTSGELAKKSLAAITSSMSSREKSSLGIISRRLQVDLAREKGQENTIKILYGVAQLSRQMTNTDEAGDFTWQNDKATITREIAAITKSRADIEKGLADRHADHSDKRKNQIDIEYLTS